MRRALLAAALVVGALPALAGSPIRLASGDLDPESQQARAYATAVPEGGPQLHLVQLPGAVRPEWVDALRETGLRVVDYVPDDAYLVYGDAAALARLSALQRQGSVAWHGAYAAELKVDAGSRRVLASGGPSDIAQWAIQLVDDPPANGPTLDLISRSRSGPELLHMKLLKYVDLIVPLPSAAVAGIAARPDVVSIHRYTDPVKLGERDAQIAAGNLSGTAPASGSYLSWLTAQGFSSSQFTTFLVDIADSGIDNGSTAPDHPGLRVGGAANGATRLTYMYLVGTPNLNTTDQGCDGHGTISAHVLGGYASGTGAPFTDAAGFHYGLGVNPFGSFGNSIIFDPWGFTHPDYVTLVSTMYQNGARISSNGWGSPTSGVYDLVAQAYDALVRDAQPSNAPYPATGNQEIVAIFAAGNQGPSAGITSPGVAKNVLTAGAAEGVQSFGGPDQCGVDDSLASSANDMHPASSRGPTADGRAKPDLVAPGTHVSGGVPQASTPATTGTALGCYASNDSSTFAICGGPGSLPSALYWPQTGQQLYTASSGTSMATPVIAGAAALLRQRFLNQGLAAPGAAMTKALLMNSARYLDGAGANDTLPSASQGMGEVNLGAAFDRVGGTTATILRDEAAADLFTATGQTRTFTGSVADTSKPFRVTLAWTDAPGSTAGSSWNNDLNLTVTVGGTTYRGNVFSGATSVPGGTADPRNNVESVFLPAGTSGAYTVTVSAANIVSDGVPGNANALDQDFALVIANATSGGGCTPPAAPTAGSNSPVPVGGTLQLTASTVSGATYAWTGPNGFTSSQQNPSIANVTAAAAGTYSVTATVSGCTSSAATTQVSIVSTSAAVKFYVLPPCRVVDTRNPAGPDGGPALSAGTSRTFPVAGVCGVPADAVSITGNVTAVTPSVAGDLRVYPGGTALPMTSTINFKAGQTRANNGIFGLGASGGVSVQTDMNSGTTHFLLDVSGYFR